MTPEELDAAIGSGDPDRVVAVLAGATEAERRAAAEVPERWDQRVQDQWRGINPPGQQTLPNKLIPGILKGAIIATAATGPRPELHYAWYEDDLRMARVLADRRPAWLASWAEQALRRYSGAWRLFRRLEREGLVPQPEREIYTLGLIAGCHNEGPAGLLRDDPEILDDVWLLFEVEGTPEASLSMADGSLREERGWARTLIRLSEEGRIPRDRLLDASLDALAQDFAQFRARWFSQFHELLAPTLDERAARRDRYLALLSSRIPPTVSFALKALAVLDKEGRLPAGELLDLAAPALTAREKGTVTTTLKLLDRAAKREPGLASRAAEVAVEALLHEAPEVQGAALELIEKHGDAGDPRLRRLLAERLGDVAASQRPRLEALLGTRGPTTDAGETAEAGLRDLVARAGRIPQHWRALAGIDAVLSAMDGPLLHAPALELPFHEVPRLEAGTELVPIESLDELIDGAALLLESFGPPEEIERVLDGLSRLCAERPADFERRTGPLRKRAGKLFGREEWDHTFWGWLPQDIPALVLAWTAAELAKREPPPEPDLDSFLGLRLWEIARRVVEGKARPLLALPTHAGGWIDARVLVERVGAADEWDLTDAVQALLRLAPDHRPAALETASGLRGELGDALRHALGASDVPVGKTAAIWAAAARARSPREDDLAVEARHPGLGPDTGRAARLKLRVEHETRTISGTTYHYYYVHADAEPAAPKKPKSELPAVLHHVKTEQEAPGRRWAATVWSAGRRAWFGRGVEAVGNNLDWWEAEWSNRVYLEALLEPDTPLCEMGRLLLALGLAAKEPGEAGLAVDALILAVRDGRLDAGGFGEALATLVVTGAIKGARWAKTLGEAARASALHREVVRDALERLLAAAPELRPADLGALLTLVHELCVESAAAVRDERARAFLAGIKGGKSGAAAKALLGPAEGDRGPHLIAARAEALLRGVERAERWIATG